MTKENSEQTKNPMLKAVDLSKIYDDVTALDSLNLTVSAEDVYCLLGANGAGKTTTINLFLNFVQPSGGNALIKGLDVVAHPLETKKYVAYIPEQVNLYRNLSGMENLEYFSALAGNKDYTKEDFFAFFDEVGLRRVDAERRVADYSKGMRQKVGIAVALAKKAEVLLLDEPTSGLDPKASNEFSRLLAKLASHGCAILMATHDLFRAKESGTKVGIMNAGRLMMEVATEDLGHAELERLYLETIEG